MADQSPYKSIPYLYRSKGVVARITPDRCPPETYIDLNNCLEREEDAMSTRYGCQLINRDPDGTPGGVNYLFTSQPTTITRLKSLTEVYRYVGAGTNLYRRAGDTQGAFTSIYSALSGEPFSSLVTNCFGTGQPFLFIADSAAMLKESGTGTPVSWGIAPPTIVANALTYAPDFLRIEDFQYSASGFTSTNLGALSLTTGPVVNGQGGVSELGGNFYQYICINGSIGDVVAGMLSRSTLEGGAVWMPFYVSPDGGLFNIVSSSASYTANDLFTFYYVSGTITGPNVTATIGKTANFDFSSYETDDLFVIAIRLGTPSNVQEIRVQFDVNSSGYTSAYYYQSISPAVYQSGVADPLSADPTDTAVAQQVTQSLGINLPQFTTGEDSWSVIYLRKGDFTAVGNAGEPGADWASITGWQIQVITNSGGGTTVDFNALYIQGGAGPSSFGGVGYDYRYTYFDATTNTDGNPSAQQLFVDNPASKYSPPALGANVGGSGIAWTNPNNITVLDGNFASAVLSPGQVSQYLYATEFSFNIPADQEIRGIIVQIVGRQTNSDFAAETQVLLLKGGLPTGLQKFFTLPSSTTTVLEGNEGDLWGTSWTPADINNNSPTVGFGVAIVATADSSANTVDIDYVRVIVYTAAGKAAGTSTIVPLRQAVDIGGQYSSNPRVTHVKLWQRGGTLPDTWRELDRITNVTGTGNWSYKNTLSDAAVQGAAILALDNDQPVTSSLPTPIDTTLASALSNEYPFNPVTVSVTDSSVRFSIGQILVIGTPDNLELAYVASASPSVAQCTACIQLPHAAGEPLRVYSKPAQPCNLCALAYNLVWLAGDPNNPHLLYYSKAGYPENFPPQNYIPVSSPSDPITAIINFRGVLFVATLTTWYQIFPGNPPYAQTTGSKHGLVASFGWTLTESSAWYQCLPEDESEILTRFGWKKREQLSIGEDVLAYDIKSKVCRWTPLKAINIFDFDGELLRIVGGRVGTRFDFSCTLDHKWVWRPEPRRKPYDKQWKAHPEKWSWCYDECRCGQPKAKTSKRCHACSVGVRERLRKACELATCGNVVQAAPVEIASSILTSREAAILGWIVTDGSISKNRGGRRCARIHQAESSRYIQDIKELLGSDLMSIYRREQTKGYSKYTVELDFALSTDFTEYLLQKATFTSRSDLPRIVCALNLESANAMLQAMISGDGSRGPDGGVCFAQNDNPVMEAFRLLAFLCGYPTNAPVYKKHRDYRDKHGKTCLVRNPAIDCQMLRKMSRRYKGKVWCPTTEFGTWVVRSNDTISITGNSVDGIRDFRGADGAYRSLPIEWVFQNGPSSLTPIPLLNTADISLTTMALWNNQVVICYKAQDGNFYRIIWDGRYLRWRNDSVHANVIYLEADTNTLVYTKPILTGYGLFEDNVGDYDDGGWVSGALVQTPIPFSLQTPYLDQGFPNNQKQYNVVTIDANPNGQTLTAALYFDDSDSISPITLGTFTGSTREKFQFQVNSGNGQQAYRVSIKITGSVTVAPIIYQADFHVAVLVEQRSSFDTYWINFGMEESKLVKQGYFDYTSTADITVNLYADGSTTPYYTFTLSANSTRSGVPVRVRFPAIKLRLFRLVATSSAAFQFWVTPQVDTKGICEGKGYQRSLLSTT